MRYWGFACIAFGFGIALAEGGETGGSLMLVTVGNIWFVGALIRDEIRKAR